MRENVREMREALLSARDGMAVRLVRLEGELAQLRALREEEAERSAQLASQLSEVLTVYRAIRWLVGVVVVAVVGLWVRVWHGGH